MIRIKKRSILLFPQFENAALIEEIRKKYDPLYKFIRPHITLVFPFESEYLQDEIDVHIRSKLKGIKPFEVIMSEITGTVNNDLFLNVKKGNDEIIRIHDLLYTDILEPFRDRRYTYTPHITVGRFADKEDLTNVLLEYEGLDHSFDTIINEITVEIIDEHENSIIETIIPIIR